MEENPLTRRRLAVGVAAVAGAVGLFAALPASAEDVDPVTFPGNQTCADLAPEGAEWNELKVEPVESGDFSDDDGPLEVTITVSQTDMGPTIDWESNIGVDAVFVKGGNVGGNLYLYDPPAESEGDTGLHAPLNPSGKWAGLSHISFCYDVEDTTTTTEGGTTTTTAKATTTTTAGATTTTTKPTTPTTPAAPAKPVVAQPTFTG